MSRGIRKRLPHPDDEPELEGAEWCSWGGELIWAVSYTEGGAPFGLTMEELRDMNRREQVSMGWARARSALEQALRRHAPPRATVDVGFVKKMGQGLNRRIYAAQIDVSPDPHGLSGAYAALLPIEGADPERGSISARETAVLAELSKLRLPFRVPREVGVVEDSDGHALVRSWLQGIPADLRAGRMTAINPARLVGSIAAAIHSIDITAWRSPLPWKHSRRAHGEEQLASFAGVEGVEIEEAAAWAAAHLPPDRDGVLLHGDLLGQNILISPEAPPVVLDWEYCRCGDPAYDLAIVTRGVHRPFQMASGLARLLDEYAKAGGEPIAPSQVQFHELCMAARWYREALERKGPEPPDQALARLRSVLRRAVNASLGQFP